MIQIFGRKIETWSVRTNILFFKSFTNLYSTAENGVSMVLATDCLQLYKFNLILFKTILK